MEHTGGGAHQRSLDGINGLAGNFTVVAILFQCVAQTCDKVECDCVGIEEGLMAGISGLLAFDIVAINTLHGGGHGHGETIGFHLGHVEVRKDQMDCFTHTGSFALNAAKGGAARVTAADISADAIAMAKRNAERNGLDNMDFLCEDTFALLPRLEKEGHPYDFIILDPPAFTKARRTVDNAMRGYKEINYRAMKLLPRGGYLATASCSHFATEELFIKMLKAAAKDAHRQLRQIEVKQQAPDHPILWGVPETNYLKFFLFQVI